MERQTTSSIAGQTSPHIGPFDIECECEQPLNLSALVDELELKMKPLCERPLSRTPSQTSQETNYKANFFILHEPFDRRSKWVWSEIYWALCNCWFYCDSGFWTLSALYNNQINARALIGQSAVGYCAGIPTEKSRVF